MIILPDFELLPHELPPASTEPLCAPANARIEVEGQEILLRVVKVEKERYVVFLRREGKNLILEHCSSSVMIWKERPVGRKLERIGRYVAQHRLFFPTQFFVVKDGNDVSRSALVGTRYMSNVNGTHSYSSRWLLNDLSRGFQFSFEDSGDVHHSLQEAVEAPTSLANRMWQLQHLTPEERAAFYQRERVERLQNQPKNRIIPFWKRLLGLD